MRNPFKPKEPTPLEVAAHELTGAQLALLTAHDTRERVIAERAAAVAKSDAEVAMFTGRIERLRATMRELIDAETEQP